MKKKLGPLPVWAWLALGAAVAYLAYQRSKESAGQIGVEEGFFPTQGIPAEGVEAGGAGVSAAEQFQARLQEVAEGREIAREEAAEERAEGREIRQEGFQERAESRVEAFEKWAAEFARAPLTTVGGRGKGKGAKGKGGNKHRAGKGAKSNRGNKHAGNAGQRHHGNVSNHQPGHSAQTNHQAARHPRGRTNVAVRRAVAPRPKQNKKRRR